MKIRHLDFTVLQHAVLPILLLFFFLLQPFPRSLEKTAEEISNVIAQEYAAFNKILQDTALVEKCFNQQPSEEEFKFLQRQHPGLFFYQDSLLLFWTKNSALPRWNSTDSKTVSVQKLQNGWYVVFKHLLQPNKFVLALLPLKFDFNPESEVLKSDFPAIYGITASHLRIVIGDFDKINNRAFVHAPDGTKLFAIEKTAHAATVSTSDVSLYIFLLFCVGVGLYLYKLSEAIFRKKGILAALLLQFLVFASMWLTVNFLKCRLSFFYQDFFRPELYSSGILLTSLFNLLLLCAFIFGVFSFVAGRLNFTYPIAQPKWKRQVHHVLLMLSVYLLAAFIAYVVKTLVLDSSISFQIFNLLSLNIYSFVGLLCVALLIYSHYLLSSKVLKLIYGITLSTSFFIASGVLLTILLIALFYPFEHASVYIASALWTTAWLFIFLFIYQDSYTLRDTTRLITVVGLYAVLATYLFENLFEIRERNVRKLVAETLLQERDYFTESNFANTSKAIESDSALLQLAVQTRWKELITEKLLSEYLSKYLTKYNVRIVFSDSLQAFEFVQLKERYYQSGTPHQSLRLAKDSTGLNTYVALLFEKQTYPIGIELKPRIYENENLYHRLLSDNYLATKVSEEGFSYAVYKNDRLMVSRGDFNYPVFWDKNLNFNGEREQFVDIEEWEHNILQGADNKAVIITVKQESLFEPVALFSYIFTILLLFFLATWFFPVQVKHLFNKNVLLESFSRSFKARLNYSMLFIIVISFVAVGYITIAFFSKQYNNYLNETASLKENSIIHAIHYSVNRTPELNRFNLYENIRNELEKYAYANKADVNFFDARGNLIYTSQPSLFDRGIVSKKIHPEAVFAMQRSNLNQINIQESIGSFLYHSTYYKIESRNETVGYIGFPYFERKLAADDEINSFLIALLNVYIFLLLMAAVVSYFISKSVTRPLSFIAEKMQIVNLGKRNELIEWNSRDEIGILVKQYNRMIRELENSAEQLAKNEREGAWREMAKQIAHEIKNPLTPMKLSIQYLQKAIDEKNPRVHELAARVTKTLIEQIDNLSAIATSFSSFAKLPKGENVPVELNEMLQDICELFGKEESVSITFSTTLEKALVFADRNQLLSVFNNLVKNGIQAVPDDRRPKIAVHVSEKHEMIQIEVKDNGTGIAEENYSKVFAPNFTTKSSGTGLGLAIAMQIIESHQGAIWFESDLGKGTTFFVVLPKMQ
jgi:signal transduction histidine kinase